MNATGLFFISNRAGESCSSTVPAETQTALGTGTSTATAGAVNWGKNSDGALSKGGLAAVVVVFGSLMAGIMVCEMDVW